MADRGLQRAPYGAVLNLITWAEYHWDWVDGQATLRHLDLLDLDSYTLLNVLVALLAEFGTPGLAAPSELIMALYGEPVPTTASDTAPAAVAAVDAVKQAMGAPAGVLRPRPGQPAAVRSRPEQPPPSEGGASTP